MTRSFWQKGTESKTLYFTKKSQHVGFGEFFAELWFHFGMVIWMTQRMAEERKENLSWSIEVRLVQHVTIAQISSISQTAGKNIWRISKGWKEARFAELFFSFNPEIRVQYITTHVACWIFRCRRRRCVLALSVRRWIAKFCSISYSAVEKAFYRFLKDEEG